MMRNLRFSRTLSILTLAAFSSAAPAVQPAPAQPPSPTIQSAPTALAPAPCGTATITVTSPSGGETWFAGSTQTITWTSSGLVEIHGVNIAL